MTEHYTFHDTVDDSIDALSDSPWEDTRLAVKDFENRSDFIAYLGANDLSMEDKTNPRYMNLLFQYASDFCKTHHDLLEEDELDRIMLLAETPRMITTQEEMNSLEDLKKTQNRLDRKDFFRLKDLKQKAIPFNQRLSRYIHTHPHEQLSTINRTLIDSSISYYPREEKRVENVIKNASKGAVYEAVALQLTDYFKIPVRPGTVEEDAKGGDLILTHGEMDIFIDIKSSLDQIAELHDGYDRITGDEKIMYAISPARGNETTGLIKIYPGFKIEELGNRCSLPAHLMDERAALFAGQLSRAVTELLQSA